jgi:hypothetical protein
MRTSILGVMVAALALSAGMATAQQSPSPSTKPRAANESQPAAQAEPPSTVPRVEVPDSYQQMILIRSTLLAVNQANLTGNYSVLRDLGTPDFQQTNSAARLSEIFRDLRTRNIDISHRSARCQASEAARA